MIRSAYRFNANWKVWLFVLLLLPVLLKLGFWQLQRAEQKRELLAQFEEQGSAARLMVSELGALSESQSAFRRVQLKGRFLHDQSILLDNQILDGRVGYHLLQPFIDVSGQAFLLNRGWLAGAFDRSLPDVPRVEGEREIIASIHVPIGKPVVLGDDQWSDSWPLRVQAVDISRIDALLPQDIFPYVLRIVAAQPGALEVNWPPVNTRPAKHTGYAVQWFAMAIALAICGVFASFSRDSDERSAS